MISGVLALMLAMQAPAAPVPPPGLVFGFYRMLAFEQRARVSGCDVGDLNSELTAIRKRLAARYGKKPFSPPEQPGGAPGDCGTVTNVYRVNMADFRKDAAAALAAPTAPAAAQE